MKKNLLVACSIAAFCCTCSSMNPLEPTIDMKEDMPVVQTTAFSDALTGLGRMSVAYGTKKLNVLFAMARDDTGTHVFTGGEIPYDISEMVKSSLNAIGGNVHLIPYEQLGVAKDFQTVYGIKPQLSNKPDICITGGITQFDRALESKKKGINASAEGTFHGRDIGIDADFSEQGSTASITVDFNAASFGGKIVIPSIQAVNSIKVYKAAKETELGFTILGPSIGLSGSMKKIEGRHAACRLLVEMSMIQIVGRYLKLPYWNLLPGLKPDQVVLDALKDDFYAMDHQTQVRWIQRLASATGNSGAASTISADNYVKLYCALPATGPARISAYSAKAADTPSASEPVKMTSVEKSPPPARAVKKQEQNEQDESVPAEKEIFIETKIELNGSETAYYGRFKPGEDITVNRLFQSDDKIRIYFAATQPAYFYWFMKGASGAHYLLFPNPKTGTNNLVQNKVVVSIPPDGSFRFDNQPGIEEINVIFAYAKIPELDQALEEALSNNCQIKNAWMNAYEAMNKYQKITLRMKHN